MRETPDTMQKTEMMELLLSISENAGYKLVDEEHELADEKDRN